jgi:hypothetical protein
MQVPYVIGSTLTDFKSIRFPLMSNNQKTQKSNSSTSYPPKFRIFSKSFERSYSIKNLTFKINVKYYFFSKLTELHIKISSLFFDNNLLSVSLLLLKFTIYLILITEIFNLKIISIFYKLFYFN